MWLETAKILFFSFTASAAFGVGFGIRPGALPYAGLGGVLTRAVLLLALQWSDDRLLYTLAAALAGAFYSELVARAKDDPMAKYLYPAMVPVIPGDLLYHTVVCFVQGDRGFFSYGAELLLALLGLALGSMLAPMLAHCPRYCRRVVQVKFGQKWVK